MSHPASKDHEPQDNKHPVALWAATTAFFSNLIALKAVALLTSDYNLRLGIGALVTSAVVAASVYAKQRLDDEKAKGEKK